MKKLPSKVAYFTPITFFSTTNRHKNQTSTNLKFCSIKLPLRVTMYNDYDRHMRLHLPARLEQPKIMAFRLSHHKQAGWK
jgi:hypothetical protein